MDPRRPQLGIHGGYSEGDCSLAILQHQDLVSPVNLMVTTCSKSMPDVGVDVAASDIVLLRFAGDV